MTTDIRTNGHPIATRVWTKGGPVDTELLPGEEVAVIHERQEASIGEPGAMALLGFATGTFIIAYVLSGWAPTTALPATLPPVLIFAGVAQFIGGLVAFRRENAFAGTAFCAFGANNVVVSTYLFMQIKGTIPTTPGSADVKMLGLELFCFAYIALMLGIVAMRLNVAFVAILLTLCAGFALTGVANFLGAGISPTWGHVGGYLLVASAACEAYTATAMVLNSTWERSVLPMVSLARRR
jgi:succinate-acetate transporter protein